MALPDDTLQFLDEADAEESPAPAPAAWRVLIVDDDQGVHLSTHFAFKEFRFAGRGVEFEGAASAREAREVLGRERPFACILLDVVMETENAGLELVHYIRRELHDETTRIILRTGQPGHAPELRVVQDYDINDYREKARSTSDHLHTALTAALRGYQQLVAIQETRRGLEMVIAASASLLSRQDLKVFAAGILTQIAALVHARPDGIVCVATEGGRSGALEVFAAAGSYAERVPAPLDASGDKLLADTIHAVLRARASRFGDRTSYLYLPTTKLGEIVVVVNTNEPIRELDRKLLELFGINIAIGFNNSFMYREIERLAFMDVLTGLPNLNGLERMLEDGLNAGKPYVLGFADIDHFEVINDGLGRAIGDQLLRHVGTQLGEMPELGVVARVGGDVFGFLFAVSSVQPVLMLPRLTEALKQTVDIDGHSVSYSVTIGAVQFEPGIAPATLTANAGVALKAAKSSRQGGFLLYEESMNAQLQSRLHLSSRMDQALQRRDFFLLYQPQLCLKSGKLIGVEALLRWRDKGQVIPPDRFIPVAESSGLILPLGRWVIEDAVAQQRAWAAAGLRLRMAVNVASRQLLEDDGLVDHVGRLLAADAEPIELELEVTESGVVGDHEAGLGRLRSMEALGVQIAIDDFGTGYSSLGQLRHLPLHRLKIDRMFIRGITSNPDDRHIAEMIVGLGRRLRLSVLAEGVEDEAQRDALREIGCDEAQGYLYAKPLPPEELVAFANRVGVVER